MEHWYAIYTKPKHERKVYKELSDKKQEVFLPLVMRLRQWKDRKKWLETPLFTSYLFVRIDYKYRHIILETNGVVKIVSFRGVPAVIPDWQIDAVKQMLKHPETLRLEKYIRPGEMVQVTDGPFKGLKGTVVKLRNETRLLITIEGIMQSVSVEIESDFLKRYEEVKENEV